MIVGITERQRSAAEAKAALYGVRFEGMQERPKGRAPVYLWTDLVTGTTFATELLKQLPEAVRRSRQSFMKAKNTGSAKKITRRPNGSGSRSRQIEEAVELSKRFFDFHPRKLRRLNISWPKAVAQLGSVARLEYLSDKFDGKLRQYFHDFEEPPMLLASAEPLPDGSSLLVIIGKKVKVKPEGITG